MINSSTSTSSSNSTHQQQVQKGKYRNFINHQKSSMFKRQAPYQHPPSSSSAAAASADKAMMETPRHKAMLDLQKEPGQDDSAHGPAKRSWGHYVRSPQKFLTSRRHQEQWPTPTPQPNSLVKTGGNIRRQGQAADRYAEDSDEYLVNMVENFEGKEVNRDQISTEEAIDLLHCQEDDDDDDFEHAQRKSQDYEEDVETVHSNERHLYCNAIMLTEKEDKRNWNGVYTISTSAEDLVVGNIPKDFLISDTTIKAYAVLKALDTFGHRYRNIVMVTDKSDVPNALMKITTGPTSMLHGMYKQALMLLKKDSKDVSFKVINAPKKPTKHMSSANVYGYCSDEWWMRRGHCFAYKATSTFAEYGKRDDWCLRT